MMWKIHDFMDLPVNFKLRECGTQEYETDVVILERDGEIAAAADDRSACVSVTGRIRECVCVYLHQE